MILLQDQLLNGEDIATCPSCSLTIRVIFDDVIIYKQIYQEAVNVIKST